MLVDAFPPAVFPSSSRRSRNSSPPEEPSLYPRKGGDLRVIRLKDLLRKVLSTDRLAAIDLPQPAAPFDASKEGAEGVGGAQIPEGSPPAGPRRPGATFLGWGPLPGATDPLANPPEPSRDASGIPVGPSKEAPKPRGKG